jgi:NADH-quinone oxidoreductase subunit L
MLSLLWLIPALPLAAFVVLILVGSRIPRAGVSIVGCAAVGISALVSILIWASPAPYPLSNGHILALWTWIDLPGFTPKVALYLDLLSMLMVCVITVVAFIILVYSTDYMAGDEGYSRFFAYMNLFVASMLTLVLADNLILLYVAWEGVGLCSYLLIGFWYKEPANVRAAVKAFVVTRIGDVGFIIGIFLIFNSLGTVDIQEVLRRAPSQWEVGSTMAMAAAALVLAGALGKSAQLPLQTWLPDAMAGPTPVSALIHAATMVTAGVYLIARMQELFALAPVVQSAVAIIGLATLLLAGFSALVQSDIKRALAYSTISQIGYMFLALGVGASSAAMFHFTTHAFFKALLFMAAGSVILSCDHEQDMFKLGGLRKQLPVTHWTFLVGAASLAGLPLVTGGFYSKEAILSAVWSSNTGGHLLWAGAAAGVLLTAIYSFRMFFLTFFGPSKTRAKPERGWLMRVPLIVLAIVSLIGIVRVLAEVHLTIVLYIAGYWPSPGDAATLGPGLGIEMILASVASLFSLVGILIAYLLFVRRRDRTEAFAAQPMAATIHRWWFVGWGFDWIYNRVFVRPFFWLTGVNRNDVADLVYRAVAWLTEATHFGMSRTQTGRVRQYAVGIAVGAIVAIGIVVFL